MNDCNTALVVLMNVASALALGVSGVMLGLTIASHVFKK